MRREDYRVSGFYGDDYLEDSRRCRIGGGDNCGHDSARRRNFDDALGFGNDADRLQSAAIFPKIFGGKPVLLALVFSRSKTCFVMSQLPESQRISKGRICHRLADLIYLCLVEFCNALEGKMRGIDRIAGLLLRN